MEKSKKSGLKIKRWSAAPRSGGGVIADCVNIEQLLTTDHDSGNFPYSLTFVKLEFMRGIIGGC